mgnify:CR=1 FL=1
MAKLGFNPFERLQFSSNICFLSGAKLSSAEETIPVFPTWLMQRYNLEEQPFKLLDESISTYKSLQLPCSASVFENAIHPLEKKIQLAFEAGYAEVAKLDSTTLFQWIRKMVYGMLYNEVRVGIKQQHALGEEFTFSQALRHKFLNLHNMLQSLITPVVFENPLPWTIKVFPVNNAPETFSYRDEINTLVFALRMNDFGIVACLQDNGANGIYQKNTLDFVGNELLHPIQFEEVSARFFYSAYLFNRLPEYTYLPTEEAVYVEPMPLRGISNKPLFDFWQNKTYGQVLENFWKPWGFLLFEIIKNPEHPKTFLTDDQGGFLKNTDIDLPLS